MEQRTAFLSNDPTANDAFRGAQSLIATLWGAFIQPA